MRCRHKLEDRVPVCAWCMAVELRQVQDKLATAERERDEAHRKLAVAVEATQKAKDVDEDRQA